MAVGISTASETTAGRDVPKDLILGSLSNLYEPVRFNHSEHTSTAVCFLFP